MEAQQLPLNHDAAWQRAEGGMEAAGSHADRVKPEWREQALEHLTRFAASSDKPFLMEQARTWAHANGLPLPPDARAWGSVTRVASSGPNPRIRRVGHGPAASSNCSPKPLWLAAARPYPSEEETQ